MGFDSELVKSEPDHIAFLLKRLTVYSLYNSTANAAAHIFTFCRNPRKKPLVPFMVANMKGFNEQVNRNIIVADAQNVNLILKE